MQKEFIMKDVKYEVLSTRIGRGCMNGQTSTTQAPGVAIDYRSQFTEGLRMARSKAIERGISRDSRRVGQNDEWPGREFGIRKPFPTETALSWQEVKHFLNCGAMQ